MSSCVVLIFVLFFAIIVDVNILFLCVANSARSQMAEGLGKLILGNQFRLESAGSSPAESVHPIAIAVLKEMNLDISANRPKQISDLPELFLKNLNLVVTLCREEQCPMATGSFLKESWALPDPAQPGQADDVLLDSFRHTRDTIIAKLEKLKLSLQNREAANSSYKFS